MRSPAFTITRRTSPPSMFSPSSGSFISVGIVGGLRNGGVLFLGIDSEVLDGLVDQLGVDLLVARQRRQRAHGDEARVDLEEVAQRFPPLAAAEAVGAE